MDSSSSDKPHLGFVCRHSDTLFIAVERCLDNGTGLCFVVDENETLLGRFTLDDARRVIREGISDLNAALVNHIGTSPEAVPAAPDNAPASEVARPLVDDKGRLVDVLVDRSRQFVQVARPDLSHREFRSALDAFLSTWISSQGAHIREFERQFSAFIGTRCGVAVTNGTVALHLALLALDIGPGDEVIVPDLTFAATVNAVLFCGATPIIVDVDPVRWSMSPSAVEQAITPRTRAIIPVHLYGRPADMTALAELAKRHGIAIVEDCAEAHGAHHRGRKVGRFSDVACFSFFANKIVTTGEGGMCVTDSETLAERMHRLRDHGANPERAYWHERVGYNYRMTNLQAAIGLAQLERIHDTVARNRRLEQLYREHLSEIPGIRFPEDLPRDSQPVIWLVSVLMPAESRDRLIEAARAEGIEMRPFFHPISAMPPYQRYARHCPNSIALSRSGLALPTSSAVDAQVVKKIAKVFHRVLESAGRGHPGAKSPAAALAARAACD